MPFPEIDVFTSHVSRIFRIEDVTAGEPKEWIARYRGVLLHEDSAAAYDQLRSEERRVGKECRSRWSPYH